MLEIKKWVGLSPEQWEIVIEGMRNPKNSWDRMDSDAYFDEDLGKGVYKIGPKDHSLAATLANGGPVHAKYRRMIDVWVTINAPLYWWKEFDTYKVGTVSNSCSTMHKIHAKEFTKSDFSNDHLIYMFEGKPIDVDDCFLTEETDGNELVTTPGDILDETIVALNAYRKKFLDIQTRLKADTSLTFAERSHLVRKQKVYWYQLIQMLPSSYNQMRTIKLNYEVLHNMYMWRKNHKLQEWHTLCDWIEKLPYSELITMKDDGDEQT